MDRWQILPFVLILGFSSNTAGAKMPHMQRLRWTGIAMHAGRLPGYRASHGRVRLSVDFAEKLYSITRSGTRVIIADDKFCTERNRGARAPVIG
jgi:hypothetical protein